MSDVWQKVVDDLRGTALNTYDLGEEVEALFERNADFCMFVDQQIFQCTCCGWWCDIDEESSEEAGLEEWTCEQCVGEMS